MTFGLLYFEYKLDETQLIQALGHWLVYLQLIKYFLPKTAEDDWFLFLLGLMQVLIGSVVNQSDQVGTVAVPLGDAGDLGARPVLPAARGPPILAGAEPTPAGSIAPRRRVDPYAGLFDVPYVWRRSASWRRRSPWAD